MTINDQINKVMIAFDEAYETAGFFKRHKRFKLAEAQFDRMVAKAVSSKDYDACLEIAFFCINATEKPLAKYRHLALALLNFAKKHSEKWHAVDSDEQKEINILINKINRQNKETLTWYIKYRDPTPLEMSIFTLGIAIGIIAIYFLSPPFILGVAIFFIFPYTFAFLSIGCGYGLCNAVNKIQENNANSQIERFTLQVENSENTIAQCDNQKNSDITTTQRDKVNKLQQYFEINGTNLAGRNKQEIINATDPVEVTMEKTAPKTTPIFQTFLENFNYCHSEGKRTSSIFWKRLPHNIQLTFQLETIANKLTKSIRLLLPECNAYRPQKERLEDFIKATRLAISEIHEARDKYRSYSSTSEGPGHTVSKYGSSGWVSTTSWSLPSEASVIERKMSLALCATEPAINNLILDMDKVNSDDIDVYRRTYNEILTLKSELNKPFKCNVEHGDHSVHHHYTRIY